MQASKPLDKSKRVQGLWGAVIRTYLRIGLLGFGGPQAHIAMLRDEIVETRRWVEANQFDEGLGLCEALPGPASSQMAIYLGWLHFNSASLNWIAA